MELRCDKNAHIPRGLMAWLAFIGVIAVIAVAIISDEMANQTVNI